MFISYILKSVVSEEVDKIFKGWFIWRLAAAVEEPERVVCLQTDEGEFLY